MLRNTDTITTGFNFNEDYKRHLYVAIDKLMQEIDELTDQERFFESNLTRTTLCKLVNDYRLCVGEYNLTNRFPQVYSYIN